MVHDPHRVAAIRKRAEAGLARVREMHVVKDEDFRDLLELTRNQFDDIESFFLEKLSRQEKDVSGRIVLALGYREMP